MRCHEAEGLLAPQVSDCLDAATQRELALHLDGCAACRARLQQEYELDRLVVSADLLIDDRGLESQHVEEGGIFEEQIHRVEHPLLGFQEKVDLGRGQPVEKPLDSVRRRLHRAEVNPELVGDGLMIGIGW